MKKNIAIIMSLLLLLSIGLTACGGSGEEASASTAQTTDASDQDAGENAKNVVTSIDSIDEDLGSNIALQIESATLYDDGSIKIIPTDDLKKNAESNNELIDGAIYPFADSGKAKEIYLVQFGNGGYRTIIALMDDGTLSALSAKELIDDHITVVMDAVSGRDNFVSVEQVEGDDAFGVIGKTEDGEEVELDFSLNF